MNINNVFSIVTLITLISEVLAAIIVMTTMGFIKAYTSYKFGDIAIKNMGKVTLNPKKHFEIIGFFLLVFTGGYGWTAPVDTSALYYKNRKRDTILVSVIPLIVALVIAFGLQVLFIFVEMIKTPSIFQMFISLFIPVLVTYFVKFAVFNLIPIYPLFGQKLFQAILPTNKALMLSQYDKIIQLLVIMFLLFGWLDFILNPIVNFITSIMSMITGVL